MNSFLKYLIILFLLIDLSAKENLEKVTLQLKWKYQFQFAGFLIAKEKGFYKNRGLDVQIKELDNKIDIVQKVIDGNLDFAISDSSLIYEALRQKPILAMMAIYQHTPFVLIGLKDSNIKSLQEINGSKIALHSGIDGIAIKTMLKTNHIQYISKPPAFSFEKLLSKEVDLMTAYISNELIVAKEKGIELVSFSPEDYGFEGYGDILFTSQEFYKNNPKKVKNIYLATFEGWQYAFNNIDEAVDIIYDKYNSLNKSKKELKEEALILKKLSEFETKFGELNLEKVKGIAQQFNIVKEEYNKLNILNEFIYDVNKEPKSNKVVNVLLGFDKPPFIFGKTSLKGIDADHLVEAFKLVGYDVNVFQATKDIQESILHTSQNDIDAVATITKKNDGLFYSDTFSTYENYVITREKDNLKIDSLEDLKNIKFVTWRTAYNDLGEEFYKLFNPLTGKYKQSYHDTPSQEEDTKLFFLKKVDAIIIDKAIFNWHKLYFNKNNENYKFHDILEKKIKEYPVTFKNKEIRDDFNKGIQKLRESGKFGKIIKFYATQNLQELLTFTKLLSDISSNYLFKEKTSNLKYILTYFFNHPDIKAISIKRKGQTDDYLKLIKTNNEVLIDNTYDLKDLQKISKKIYFNEQDEFLELGELSLYYSFDYKTKNGNLLPSLKKLKALDQEEYSFIEKTYKKYNVNNNSTFNTPQQRITIKVCYAKDLQPLIFEDNSEPKGISKDYLEIISKNMNIEFKYIVAPSIKEQYKMIKNNKCDIIPVIVKEPNQFNFLIPTKHYLNDYLALATTIQQPYEIDLLNLKDKKIGINKGYKNIIFHLEKLYPNIKFIQIDKDGLKQVKNGKLYGYIEPAFMLSYKILNFYHNDLKIMKTITSNRIKGSIGINKNKKELLPILNQAIEQFTMQEHNNILSNWKKLKYEREIDYTYVWYTISIFLIILLIVFIAYVKQNKLKKKIEIEKDKFKNIFNQASDGVLILNDGLFIDCNQSIIDILGYKNCSDIIGLSLDHLSPKQQPDGQLSLKKSKIMISLAILNGYHNFEWKYINSKKEELWCDIMLTNISTESDQILHMVFRDISEKKLLQDELKNINATLKERVNLEVEKNKKQQLMIIHQNRLAQMGEMISMIAHQWRQPLNNLSIINNNIALKYSKNKLDDTVIERFKENSKKQIQLMSKTIDDFRDFFKPNKQIELFKLNNVIENTFDILKPLFVKHNISYKLDAKGLFTIKGYSNELGQALLNILNNSIDALIEKKIEDKKVEIKLYAKDTFIYIEISDNAKGIAIEHLDKIFDPYFSTKTEKNGTGLGLYMTKMIIEEHMNGSLEVKNNEKGALFIIRFSQENNASF